jgi:RNA polymerase sigma-B factor
MSHTASEDRRRREVTDCEFRRAAGRSGSARREHLQRVAVVNMPVARAVARRYAGRGVADDDLEQLAYLGLMSAANRFDPTKEHDFLTFAVPWMTGTIRRHFRDQTWVIRPHRRVQELHQELAQLEGSGNGSLSVEEAAARLGVTPDQVREVHGARMLQKPRSLHEPGRRGDEVPLGEQLVAEETVGMRSADARLLLEPAFRVLAPRERHVLRRLYIDEWTQEQIGREIGLSQMSISRIHHQALTALRGELGVAA